MQSLSFSYNWNNKLNCESFTSLRLRNDKKFVIGSPYEIILKSAPPFRADLIGIKHLYLHKINEYIARLDTGYSAIECRKVIKTMYSKKNIDWKKTQLSFLLFKKIPTS